MTDITLTPLVAAAVAKLLSEPLASRRVRVTTIGEEGQRWAVWLSVRPVRKSTRAPRAKVISKPVGASRRL